MEIWKRNRRGERGWEESGRENKEKEAKGRDGERQDGGSKGKNREACREREKIHLVDRKMKK